MNVLRCPVAIGRAGLLCLLALTLLSACGDRPEAGPTARQDDTRAPPAISATAPTPALTPPSTPPPTPTTVPPPTATPAPSPSLHLRWFDSPEDHLHSSARMSIEAIWEADEKLGLLVVRLPWAGDGVTERELQLLQEIAGLAKDHPDLARTVLEYRWIWSGDGVSSDAPRAIAAIRAGVATDPRLARLLAGYEWLENGVGAYEADALAALAKLAEQGVDIARSFAASSGLAHGIIQNVPKAAAGISRLLQSDPALGLKVAGYPWIQDGVTYVEVGVLGAISELATPSGSPNSGLAGKVAAHSWVADGIQPHELGDIRMFQELLAAADAGDSGLAEELAGHPWVADGVDEVERDALYAFRSLLKTGGIDHSGFVERLAGYSWVADGINEVEPGALYALRDLLDDAGVDDTGFMEKLADYSWISDGITEIERDRLIVFRKLLDLLGVGHPGLVEKMAGYSWVADGIDRLEQGALYSFRGMMEVAGEDNPGLVQKVAGYRWVADGVNWIEWGALGAFRNLLEIAGVEHSSVVEKMLDYSWVVDNIGHREETMAIRDLHRMLEIAVAENSGVVEKLAGYPWVADRSSLEERSAIRAFRRMLEAPGAAKFGVVEKLVDYSWVADGINRFESGPLGVFADLLEADGIDNSGLLEKMAGYSWVADGIDPIEQRALYGFRDLLRAAWAVNFAFSQDLMTYPWVADGISAFEASALSRVGSLLEDTDPELAQQPWLADGIDDEELAFLAVLHATKDRSLNQYRDLLDSHHARSKTISLPLAGEVKLVVIRHSRFPAGDDTIRLMEIITRALEELMQVPFPRNPAVMGIVEPSLRSGEEPQYGVGYSLRDQLVVTARKYNPDFHLAVFHEMSHVYWGGHTGAPPWFTEGAAGFLPDYAREVMGVESIEERRKKLMGDLERECLQKGVGNIQELLELLQDGWDPQDARNICTYILGEFFLLETYGLLGHDATLAAMRELYLWNKATGVPISEMQIYESFLSNAPPEKEAAFRDLYRRIHGADSGTGGSGTP